MKYHIRYFIDQILFANDRKRCIPASTLVIDIGRTPRRR